MIRYLKQKFCKHYFHLIHSYEKDVDGSVGYDLQKVYIVWCEKCDKEEELLEHQYQALLSKQRMIISNDDKK